jgi:hypothetical protein
MAMPICVAVGVGVAGTVGVAVSVASCTGVAVTLGVALLLGAAVALGCTVDVAVAAVVGLLVGDPPPSSPPSQPTHSTNRTRTAPHDNVRPILLISSPQRVSMTRMIQEFEDDPIKPSSPS